MQPWLRYLGGHPAFEKLVEAHGLKRYRLKDPYEILPLLDLLDFQEDAAVLIGDPVLGARFGQQTTPTDLGPAGILMLQSTDLRRGLARYAASVSALQGATIMRIEEETGIMSFSYQIQVPDMTRWPQDAELSLSSTCQMIRSCFDRRWKPIEVHFAHRPSPRPDLLERIFRAPVRFAAGVNRLIFSTEGTDIKHRVEDAALIQVIERHVADLSMIQNRDYNIDGLVRDIVARLTGYADCSLRSVAREAGLTPRSLQRRLAAQGTSLRDIQREARLSIVERQMADPGRTLSEIAQALGYSDGTVFWRAYRNWTGMAPSEARGSGRDAVTP
jgi:AraC-like DNA-binding protein